MMDMVRLHVEWTNAKTDLSFLFSVLNIDAACYPTQWQGTLQSVRNRFNANPESYILLYDKAFLLGYMNFFPVTPGIVDRLREGEVVDDNLRSADILPWRAQNDILLLSIAMYPGSRDREGIRMIADSFREFIKNRESRGQHIRSRYACAVTPDGDKAASHFGLVNRTAFMLHSLYYA